MSLFDLGPFTLPSITPVWERHPGASGGTCGAWYLHVPSGMTVQHCGHPTANFPYYIVAADGTTILAPNGRAFRLLADAKTHVELLWRMN